MHGRALACSLSAVDTLPPSRTSLPAGWWGRGRHAVPRPRSVAELVRDRVLDAELAALLWLLLEARLPILVAGAPGSGRTTVLTALLDLLPPDARRLPLAGAMEDFDWLPEAPELGWRQEHVSDRRRAARPAAPASRAATVLLVSELGDLPPDGTWGAQARVAIRALSIGYGMAATMAAERLEAVFERLKAAPVGADDDELSRLGLVLVVRTLEDVAPDRADPWEAPRRIAAAHYVRPVVRDAHGHVQRMPPAVLAAHDPTTDRLEHFAWGIVAELAGRTGRRAVDFEREQARRAQYLAGLAAAGIIAPDDVRAALLGYRGVGDRPAG